MHKLMEFENKKIRAKVIKKYMDENNYTQAVCFTCGNASKELKKIGVNVLEISQHGDLTANKWFKISDIKNIFSNMFDATSGHLDIELMNLVSKEFKKELGELQENVLYVPTGSGETLVCLKMAYPKKEFVAVYNIDNATKYEKEAPLNKMVEACTKEIIYIN